MRRLCLLVGLVPLLTGCFYVPLLGGSSSSGTDEASSPQSNLRNSVPAIEAWYADHGTYAGMTVDKLRTQYDYGISLDLKIVRATKKAYCIESTVAGETWSYAGPARGLAAGRC
jgi:hypothetical protein